MTELKKLIIDLAEIEKNPETIAQLLKEDGHNVTVAQVKDVLGIKEKPTTPPNTIENVGDGRRIISGGKAEYFELPSLSDMKYSAQERAADGFVSLIESLTELKNEKSKKGKDISRYVAAIRDLNQIKKRLAL